MKRRLFAAFISILIILPQTYVIAQAAEPTEFGTVLLTENFETENPADGTAISGWNNWEQDDDSKATSTFNSSNTITTDGTNKVASIKRTATTATDLGSYFFKKPISVPRGSDLISIKFRARRMDTNAAGLIVRLYGPNAGNNGMLESNTFFYMNAGNGYLWWKDSMGAATYRYALSGANAIGAVNTWYDIEIVVDYASEKIEAYIEGAYAGYAPLESNYSNIYGLPTAISFGTQRAATYWGGMAENTSDAEFQVDDILVTAYKGNLAYSSPANGEETVDISTSEIDLIFNHEITDTTNAEFVLDSQETTQIPLITQATFDSVNKRKVTLTLSGSFDYGKKYMLLSTGAKNAYQKEMPLSFEFTTRERRFMINTPVFTISNAPAAAIADGAVSAKIRIDNEFTSEKPLTVVAASFMANGQLKDVDYTVTAVDTEDYIEPELTVDAEASGKISLLILDSFSALNPVIGEYVFDSQGLSEPSAINPTSATSILATVDYDGSGEATLSGSAGDGSVVTLVLKPNFAASDLTEINRESASSMIEYIGLADGSTFSKTYVPRMPVDNLNSYSAYATGVSTPYSFRVFDAATVTNVLNAVKNSTKDTLRDMLKAENPTLLEGSLNINDILALNLTDYYTLTEPQLVTDEIAGQAFTKVSDLRTRYNEVLPQKLEYERVGKQVVTAVNDAVWSDLELLLTNNDSVLTLDWTGDYQNISDKVSFYKKLASDYTFTTEGTTVTLAIKNIRDIFSSLAKAVLEAEADDDDDYSPGGGGGSGGGKNIKLPVQTVVVSKNNEESGVILFNDIGDTAWAEVAINALAKKNVINGVGNGKFEPNATVTREQFVKMLVLALELPMEFSDAPFDDVTAADWYYHYVHTAYKNGIVYPASSFGAGRAISRAEMAAMCYRAAQTVGIKMESDASLDFADSSSIPDYAKEAVATLAKSKIIHGIGENTFAPDDSSTRAQAAKIIYGIMQLKGGMD